MLTEVLWSTNSDLSVAPASLCIRNVKGDGEGERDGERETERETERERARERERDRERERAREGAIIMAFNKGSIENAVYKRYRWFEGE